QRGPGGFGDLDDVGDQGERLVGPAREEERPDEGPARVGTGGGITSDRGLTEIDPGVRTAGVEVAQPDVRGRRPAGNRLVARIVEEGASRVRVPRRVSDAARDGADARS